MSLPVTIRLARPAVSVRVRPRVALVGLVLLVLAFLLLCLGMTIGEVPMGLSDVLSGLFGVGDTGNGYIVQELRLPRALTGLLAGLAFGASGAVFQTITRNPLASPDMIGINAGAATAVVAGLAFGFGDGLGSTSLGLLGGLASGLIVYVLAWRRGTSGYRILLVGIGISAMCTSLTDYLLSKAQITEAQASMGWLVGNLANRGWDNVVPLFAAFVVLFPLVLGLSRWMSTLQLGDEVAAGLGTPVQPVRLGLLLAGAGLVAFATASAGPIAFVALTAPQIAQRLARLSSPPVVASALGGAVLVLGSDIVARVITPTGLPVGIVTGALGAPVLLWLLVRANRSGSGG
ncbi:iron chelate uptake ABC transporter family permease subunit [Kutzneria sp. 744]|uniref:FecCD family ABC transporter permease n=1 Tax=Kutzneria sp. (strain 744) TaxID=345341 RepID=UPI0003EEBF75|nr:iron chelate uptake ABC transporter family permease subunit [Kutzneria sp. 744]EWM11107.1 ferric enterobactin transporter permease component [Kutzneria sp. 744]